MYKENEFTDIRISTLDKNEENKISRDYSYINIKQKELLLDEVNGVFEILSDDPSENFNDFKVRIDQGTVHLKSNMVKIEITDQYELEYHDVDKRLKKAMIINIDSDGMRMVVETLS